MTSRERDVLNRRYSEKVHRAAPAHCAYKWICDFLNGVACRLGSLLAFSFDGHLCSGCLRTTGLASRLFAHPCEHFWLCSSNRSDLTGGHSALEKARASRLERRVSLRSRFRFRWLMSRPRSSEAVRDGCERWSRGRKMSLTIFGCIGRSEAMGREDHGLRMSSSRGLTLTESEIVILGEMLGSARQAAISWNFFSIRSSTLRMCWWGRWR